MDEQPTETFPILGSQSQRSGPRQKTQSDASVTHMGHALHHASLPKLLQGHETQPKNAKRDTEEQVLL